MPRWEPLTPGERMFLGAAATGLGIAACFGVGNEAGHIKNGDLHTSLNGNNTAIRSLREHITVPIAEAYIDLGKIGRIGQLDDRMIERIVSPTDFHGTDQR